MTNTADTKPIRVLLVGRVEKAVDDVVQQLQTRDIEVFGSTSVTAVQATLARTQIDHVIMGAGIALEDRLDIAREIFRVSNTTTIHMKDPSSGPQGFLLFARNVLQGLLASRNS